MTEYFRQENNLIQADLALHSRRLLDQYLQFAEGLPPKDRYEGTLTLCVLQTLLTTCSELLSDMSTAQKQFFGSPIAYRESIWGLRREYITTDVSGEPQTLSAILKHLRNAVSHPTAATESGPPSTGYTTVKNGSGPIDKFRFVHSPWVKDGQILDNFIPKSPSKVEEYIRARTKLYPDQDWGTRTGTDGKERILLNRRPYAPIFVLDFPLTAMIEFSSGLANRLAHLTIPDWDGKRFIQLVA